MAKRKAIRRLIACTGLHAAQAVIGNSAVWLHLYIFMCKQIPSIKEITQLQFAQMFIVNFSFHLFTLTVTLKMCAQTTVYCSVVYCSVVYCSVCSTTLFAYYSNNWNGKKNHGFILCDVTQAHPGLWLHFTVIMSNRLLCSWNQLVHSFPLLPFREGSASPSVNQTRQSTGRNDRQNWWYVETFSFFKKNLDYLYFMVTILFRILICFITLFLCLFTYSIFTFHFDLSNIYMFNRASVKTLYDIIALYKYR